MPLIDESINKNKVTGKARAVVLKRKKNGKGSKSHNITKRIEAWENEIGTNFGGLCWKQAKEKMEYWETQYRIIFCYARTHKNVKQ